MSDLPKGSSVVVEFVGPPGVGKSTVSALVSKRLQTDGFDVKEPVQQITLQPRLNRIITKSHFVISYTFRKPKRVCYETSKISRTNQARIRDTIKVVFNWHYLCGLMENIQSNVVLFDQGLYQALWSIGYQSLLDWRETIRMVSIPEEYLPDLVVIVEANSNTIESRLMKRGGDDTRVTISEQTEVERAINGIQHLTRLIEERTDSISGHEHIVVKNESRDDLQAATNDIVNKIDGLNSTASKDE